MQDERSKSRKVPGIARAFDLRVLRRHWSGRALLRLGAMSKPAWRSAERTRSAPPRRHPAPSIFVSASATARASRAYEVRSSRVASWDASRCASPS